MPLELLRFVHDFLKLNQDECSPHIHRNEVKTKVEDKVDKYSLHTLLIKEPFHDQDDQSLLKLDFYFLKNLLKQAFAPLELPLLPTIVQYNALLDQIVYLSKIVHRERKSNSEQEKFQKFSEKIDAVFVP